MMRIHVMMYWVMTLRLSHPFCHQSSAQDGQNEKNKENDDSYLY